MRLESLFRPLLDHHDRGISQSTEGKVRGRGEKGGREEVGSSEVSPPLFLGQVSQSASRLWLNDIKQEDCNEIQ
jgi:hypothetical protein